ncbi:MAG: Asp-tRNA(Asn)/Glu-tRNA(Gln) amidotransferase subunit GatB [Candidatus Omnitrophica bacterium]|nr:Asp-tRNA(Asn)/Glu-tRNA(Gln) amidotransferase subunit GatB [Candidatus Omnitrophota bacterium]
MNKKLETVIGLEVHLQFNTKTKIFCGCENVFGREPNTCTCPVCLGLPGSLPVLNQTALKYAIKVALALSAEVNSYIKFDRKNYYYPDLPKGYQISQFDFPIGHDGFVMIPVSDGQKKIRIHRAHLEEDAGKLIHDSSIKGTLADYNRTGTPLMEIVTEPDLRSPQEAYDYLTTLKLILQYLGVSDCDMEKGSLRCDANISVREKGDPKLGTKAELKNMNSFKAVKAGLEFEENRHSKLFLAGEEIIQETRLWDENKGVTVLMRTKEDAHDYRYFPEPDLVPFTVDASTIEEIRKSLPELPAERFENLIKNYTLSEYDARILIQDPNLADFFEQCTKSFDQVKKICNWINGPLLKELNDRKATIQDIQLPAEELASLIQKVEDGTVSNLAGKDILRMMIDENKAAETIIQEKGLAQVSDDSALEKIINDILAENQNVVDQIKDGKQSAMGFLIGQAMRKSQGKANPKKVGEMIKRRIHNA